MPALACYDFSCPSSDVGTKKFERSSQCKRRTRGIEIRSFVAIETVARRIHLDFYLSARHSAPACFNGAIGSRSPKSSALDSAASRQRSRHPGRVMRNSRLQSQRVRPEWHCAAIRCPSNSRASHSARGLAARKKRPRLDAAVLGAAIQIHSDIDRMDAQWREVIDVNFKVVVHCMNANIPVMKAQKFGSIVTFNSGLAKTCSVGASTYAASKAALVGVTKSARHELRTSYVRANIRSPGLRTTPISMDGSTRAERECYRSLIGISEASGVVPAQLYLISDWSENLQEGAVQ
jgi:NAD(P)-dependent dehydrogenase (short-subunit alcohol dehydrogenase family)